MTLDEDPRLRTRRAPALAASYLTQSGHGSGVSVIRVHGRLSDAAGPAYEAVLHALARDARTIVCDLSGAQGSIQTGAAALLASAGAHVIHWTGSLLAFASPDAGLRAELRRHAGEPVVVTPRTSDVLASSALRSPPLTKGRSLAPVASSRRAARELVERACREWDVVGAAGLAGLVAAELMDNAVSHARDDLRLTVAKSGGWLRVSVRDSTPSPPPQPPADATVAWRGTVLVGSLAQSWGVLPTSEGGTVVWAVVPA